MTTPGTALHGLRYDPSGDQHWQTITLDSLISSNGGAGAVWSTLPKSNPPLVAKLYLQGMKGHIANNINYGSRLIALVQHRDALSERLPFCAWPRRLLFHDRNLTPSRFSDNLAGFTMQRLHHTIPLTDVIATARKAVRIEPHDALHIALLLADQLSRLHAHPWRFVFGDLSPNNIHITPDFKKVLFIDTDGFQFSLPSPQQNYTVPGFTERFTSPFQLAVPIGTMLPAKHDLFVLSILLFCLIFAANDLHRTHPFTYGENIPENQSIQHQRFPYALPSQYPPPPYLLSIYQTWPNDFRAAFHSAFIDQNPLSAAQWSALLRAHWGSLLRPSSST